MDGCGGGSPRRRVANIQENTDEREEANQSDESYLTERQGSKEGDADGERWGLFAYAALGKFARGRLLLIFLLLMAGGEADLQRGRSDGPLWESERGRSVFR